MLVHVLDGTSIRCKCTDLDPATIPGLWVSKKCESSSGWLPTILNWSNCLFKVRMLGCGQTITVSTQELSVHARICSITFSQWTYSCASFLVANWILVIGSIQPTQGSGTGVQEIKDNPPPGSVQEATEPPLKSETRDKASSQSV
jgi:hypothetical protein